MRRSLRGPWRAIGALGLLATGACTRSNPAYRPLALQPDAEAVLVADAGAPLPDRMTATADVAPPAPDLEADLAPALPDLAVDLPPPAADLAPDLRPAESVVTGSLVAHWRLDEGGGTSVRDDSGMGNDGTTKGGPTWSAGAPGIRFVNSSALAFDGKDDWVELGSRGLPASEAPKSLALWVRAVNPGTIPIRTLLSLFNDAANAGIQLGIDSGRIAAWFYGDPKPRLLGPALDGAWHHVALTFDGMTHRLYLDGVEKGSDTPMPAKGAIVTVRLGTYMAPEELFSGFMDDVRVYARALDPGEVTTLAAGQ